MPNFQIPRTTVTALIAFVLAFDLAFAAQRLSGAYRSEFGGHAGEASQFMAGLFWRDFIVSYARDRVEGKREAFGTAKANFASRWEAHYPRVETGAHHSIFTALETLWMLAFPATRGSLLILMAGIAAILATLLYLALRKEFGAMLAGLTSSLLLLIPVMRDFTATALPDAFLAVLLFGSALGAGALLDRRNNRERLVEGRKLSGRWIAAGALLIAVSLRLVFTSPIHQPRYWLPAIPAALMLAHAGARWLVNRLAESTILRGKKYRLHSGVATLLFLLAFSSALAHWSTEINTGSAPLAETLIEDSSIEDVTLVSSDAEGEERFIAELAVREARPGHIVLSGTQHLGRPGKRGASDEPVYDSDGAVFTFLTSGRIKYIVLDDSVPDEARREHHYQLKRAIDSHLDRFWSIATCPITRGSVLQTTPVTLYKLRDGN